MAGWPSWPGRCVEVRARMDALVLAPNCPQVNNSCNGINPAPIRMLVWAGSPED